MKPSTAKYWLNFYTHTRETLFRDTSLFEKGGGAICFFIGQAACVVFGGLVIGAVLEGNGFISLKDAWTYWLLLQLAPLACTILYWPLKLVYSVFAGLGYAMEQKLKVTAEKPESLPNYVAVGEVGGELSFPERRSAPKTIHEVR